MSKIRLLSTEEIKLIAAGEVVESPASIVKELIENSFDAEASSVSLAIEEGGIKTISVRDNGKGIEKEDLTFALFPHATSKLISFKDSFINNNDCYGFRGEALAAISGVSELILRSRPHTTPHGYEISSHNGKITEPIPCGSNYGTTIDISNLFEAIPARKKYLPSKLTLEKNILYAFQGLALGKPTIEMTFIKESKIIHHLFKKETFIERATDFLTHSVSSYANISYSDEYCSIEGLISHFEYGQYDRSKIYILVNGRLVKQPKLTQICIKAYQSEQFQKRFPEIFIDIHVPNDQVDINVHPRKEEVLFLYQKKIESILLKIIIQALDKRTKELMSAAEDTLIHTQNVIPEKRISYEIEKLENNNKHNIDFLSQENKKIEKKVVPAVFFANQKSETSEKINLIEGDNISLSHEPKEITASRKEEKLDVPLLQKKETDFATLFQKEKKTLKYIGTLDRTYLLFLREKSILCIDQHALHEKIMYEDFMKKKQNEESTFHRLLFEQFYALGETEVIALEKNKDFIEECFFKFTLTQDKKNIILNEISYALKNIDRTVIIKKIINTLMREEHNSKKEKLHHIWHEIAALYACKNAIKGGESLSENQIIALVNEAQNYEKVFFCPHGRPSLYEINVTMLEKLFKRNE